MFQDEFLVVEQSMNRQPKWPSDLQHPYIDSYWARRAVDETHPINHMVMPSMVLQLYDRADHILLMAFVPNKHPTIFILKALEGCGWESFEKKKRLNVPSMIKKKLELMMRFPFWSFGGCEVPLHYHYSQVQCLGPSMGQIKQFNHLLRITIFNYLKPYSCVQIVRIW